MPLVSLGSGENSFSCFLSSKECLHPADLKVAPPRSHQLLRGDGLGDVPGRESKQKPVSHRLEKPPAEGRTQDSSLPGCRGLARDPARRAESKGASSSPSAPNSPQQQPRLRPPAHLPTCQAVQVRLGSGRWPRGLARDFFAVVWNNAAD